MINQEAKILKALCKTAIKKWKRMEKAKTRNGYEPDPELKIEWAYKNFRIIIKDNSDE